jgi:pimeloyl-ACP methyl ester carboxylesterase
MAKHQLGGLSVNFERCGAGPDVVLLHAGGSSGAQWRKSAPYLEKNYHLIMPDFIGFGATEPWTGPSEPSHDDQARQVASLIEAECGGPAHIVGHSFGGAIATRLALAQPELFRALVLIEPVLTPLLNLAGREDVFAEYHDLATTFIENGRAGRDEAAWRGFIDYRNGVGTWDGLSEKARMRFHAGTQSAVDTFVSNLADPTTLEDVRTIVAPTLILCGEKTTEPDRVVTEILHDELPNSAYQIISEAEHMSPLTHPEPVAGAIMEHLKSYDRLFGPGR